MVYYLAATGDGVENYAETERDFLDAEVDGFTKRVRFLNPDEVHPRSKKDNADPREQGYWVDPESLPKKFLWQSGDRPIPDVLMWFIVSPRFKELVEQFEPDVHQFIPIEIYKEREGGPVATHYWFVVGQRLDSVDEDQTTYKWVVPKDDPSDGHWTRHLIDYDTLEITDIPGAKLVHSSAKTEGHHVWHDPHLLTFGNGLCSDAFAEAAIAAQFTGLSITERETASLENGDREAA